jgi:hypothetical protein
MTKKKEKKVNRLCGECGGGLEEYQVCSGLRPERLSDPKIRTVCCPTRKALNFNGFDYTELIEAYGLDYLPGEEDDLNFDDTLPIKEYWEWLLFDFTSKCKEWDWHKAQKAQHECMAEAADILRKYLIALAMDPWSDTKGFKPLWLGMAQMDCDHNMLNIARRIVGHMWS